MKDAATHLDDPARGGEIRAAIQRKPSLVALYKEFYCRYQRSLAATSGPGVAIEIGAGLGFAQECVPGLLATDILPYEDLDAILDATRMPFADQSLRFIAMLNTFHHIPDVEAFLREADRCLRPGGRILILDQHLGWLSRWIFKYAHHEPFDPAAREWRFATSGPLSGANGALAWMVFRRDLELFHRKFPNLRLNSYEPHTPLRYWLTGGLKSWNLLPFGVFPLATALDAALCAVSGQFGSFCEIEAEKR